MKMQTIMLMFCLTAPAMADDEDYKLGPDSMRQDGVPQGTVTEDVWHSKVFPETVGDYSVYVLAQCGLKFVGGTGGHSGKHGGAILPDSLRWLWRAAQRKTDTK